MDDGATRWREVGSRLDQQLLAGEFGTDVDQTAQQLVDDAYTATCDALRLALSEVACWKLSQMNRGQFRHRRVEWERIGKLPSSFVMAKVRSALESAARGAEDPEAAKRSMDAFTKFYQDLFKADAYMPFKAFQ